MAQETPILSSQDILAYVNEANPTGEVRAAFATVAAWMFNRELFFSNLEPALNSSEIECLSRKDKVGAVKLYRQRVGCGLIESKVHVEEYMVKNFGNTHFERP